MPNRNMAPVRRPNNAKLKSVGMTPEMMNMEHEIEQSLNDTRRFLLEHVRSNDKQMTMPETQHFIEEYLMAHKPELEAIDINAKGSTLRIRRLLAETLHQAIDAVAADIIEGFRGREKKRGSAGSAETLKGLGEDEEVVGEMSEEDEDEEGCEVRDGGKGRVVGEEMTELREVVKEAVDDALW